MPTKDSILHALFRCHNGAIRAALKHPIVHASALSLVYCPKMASPWAEQHDVRRCFITPQRPRHTVPVAARTASRCRRARAPGHREHAPLVRWMAALPLPGLSTLRAVEVRVCRVKKRCLQRRIEQLAVDASASPHDLLPGESLPQCAITWDVVMRAFGSQRHEQMEIGNSGSPRRQHFLVRGSARENTKGGGFCPFRRPRPPATLAPQISHTAAAGLAFVHRPQRAFAPCNEPAVSTSSVLAVDEHSASTAALSNREIALSVRALSDSASSTRAAMFRRRGPSAPRCAPWPSGFGVLGFAYTRQWLRVDAPSTGPIACAGKYVPVIPDLLGKGRVVVRFEREVSSSIKERAFASSSSELQRRVIRQRSALSGWRLGSDEANRLRVYERFRIIATPRARAEHEPGQVL